MTRVGAKAGGLFWVTLSSVFALSLLGGLGTWQLQRMSWKEALVEKIQARSKAEPIILDAAATLFGAGEDLEYTPVRARGRFLTDKEMYYFAPGEQGPGHHVYVPLVGPSGVVVMVNRGFITEAERGNRGLAAPTATAAAGTPSTAAGSATGPGTIDVIGLLRRPEAKALFAPANDPGRNMWYWRDLKGMADQSFGDNSDARKKVLPFIIEAVAAPAGTVATAGTPRGGVTRLTLPNRHLEYALTWYGLGAALIGVYLVFVRNRLLASRERFILGGRRSAARRRSWGKT